MKNLRRFQKLFPACHIRFQALVFVLSSFISDGYKRYRDDSIILYSGKIAPWTGRFYSLLDPSYAKNNIPIIASVSEHQPTTWSSFYFDLQVSCSFGEIWYTNVCRVCWSLVSSLCPVPSKIARYQWHRSENEKRKADLTRRKTL